MSKFARPKIIIPITALLAIAADQLSKFLLLDLYRDTPPPIHLTDFFSLVMVWNHGVSFGMLNKAESGSMHTYIILGVTLVIVAALIRAALLSTIRMERIAYALVIGGALGNVIDRLHFGAVVDFLYFHLGAMGWPAFNVADSLICIGVFILLLTMLRNSKMRP